MVAERTFERISGTGSRYFRSVCLRSANVPRHSGSRAPPRARACTRYGTLPILFGERPGAASCLRLPAMFAKWVRSWIAPSSLAKAAPGDREGARPGVYVPNIGPKQSLAGLGTPSQIHRFSQPRYRYRGHVRLALEQSDGRIEGREARRPCSASIHTLRARMRRLGIEWSSYRTKRWRVPMNLPSRQSAQCRSRRPHHTSSRSRRAISATAIIMRTSMRDDFLSTHDLRVDRVASVEHNPTP